MSDCTNCEYFKTIKESSIIPLNCRECVWQGNGKEDNYKALSVVNVEYDMFYCNSCGQEIKQIIPIKYTSFIEIKISPAFLLRLCYQEFSRWDIGTTCGSI